MSNLPKWPGAASCYSRAYQLLERMRESGHVTTTRGGCVTSPEMDDLIESLDRGDETRIKRILLDDVTDQAIAMRLFH